MDKKQRKKMEFGREDKSNKERKQNRKKRSILKQAFWGKKIEKTSEIAGNIALLGLITNQKHKNTGNKKQNHQKETLFCILENTPPFL